MHLYEHLVLMYKHQRCKMIFAIYALIWLLALTFCYQGNYSENDESHWTPELRRALNYDRTQALQVDNGRPQSLRKFYF